GFVHSLGIGIGRVTLLQSLMLFALFGDVVHSDDTLLGEPFHLAWRTAEQLGQYPHIILAIARRAAIGRAAAIGMGLAELHLPLIDRPGADLGAGDLGQPFEVPQLRVGADAVLGILAYPGRHAGALQFHHAVVTVLGAGPCLDGGVERVLMLEAVLQRTEAPVVEPFALLGDLRQSMPFGIGEAGDGDPAVLAGATVGAVRRGRLIGRAVAVAPPLALIGRPVEDRRAGQEDAGLALRGVDPLALAGALAVIDRAEQGQRVAIGAHPVEIGIAP